MKKMVSDPESLEGREVLDVLVARIEKDDKTAWDELFQRVYRDLRAIGGAMMGDERRSHTLTPTALVHEAYLRIGGRPIPAEDDKAFIKLTARVMRQVLIDHARRRNRLKRQSRRETQGVDSASEPLGLMLKLEDEGVALDLLHVALKRLENHQDPLKQRLAEAINLRLRGKSNEEVAEELGVSIKTVERVIKEAREKLRRIMASLERGRGD